MVHPAFRVLTRILVTSHDLDKPLVRSQIIHNILHHYMSHRFRTRPCVTIPHMVAAGVATQTTTPVATLVHVLPTVRHPDDATQGLVPSCDRNPCCRCARVCHMIAVSVCALIVLAGTWGICYASALVEKSGAAAVKLAFVNFGWFSSIGLLFLVLFWLAEAENKRRRLSRVPV